VYTDQTEINGEGVTVMTYPDVNSWEADHYADEMGAIAEHESMKEDWMGTYGMDIIEELMREEDGLVELMEKKEFLDKIVDLCLNDPEMIDHIKSIPYYERIINIKFNDYVYGLKYD
jgi:hypothetical protein